MPKKRPTSSGNVNTNAGLSTTGITVTLRQRADGSYEVVLPAELAGKTATLVTMADGTKRWKIG